MAIRPNKYKQKVLRGEQVFGITFPFPSINALDIVGNLGFDFIFLEGEHGSFSLQDIEQMCITANALGLTVHARVPKIQPSTILQFLDRGVQGIMGPHIRTREDAELLARACRHAPQGIRSFYWNRTADYGQPEDTPAFLSAANDEMWVSALLEDREAVEENLDGILAVEGLDAVSIGHVDLSQSMGHPGDWKHPEVAGAMANAWQKIDAAGKNPSRGLAHTAHLAFLLKAGASDFLRAARAAK
jgi:2-keto-3-deoxy-L-rhamnonate aldolase RhmA